MTDAPIDTEAKYFSLPQTLPSDSPAVSVIIIFLNAAQFLEDTIESVLGQTFTNWELVLVDDGSTDASTQIAIAYALRDSARIRYIQHPDSSNHGMSASRNLGIENTSAPLIAFLDADDIWIPTKLDEQIAILAVQPQAAIVFGHSKYWYGWTGKTEDLERDYVRHCGDRSGVLVRPPYFLKTSFLEGRYPSPSMSSVTLRRDCLKQVGGFEEVFRTTGEDTVFLAKIFLNCYAYYADACWDWYRQHPSSFTATALKQGSARDHNLVFARWMKAYFAEQGVTDPYLVDAVDDNLRLGSHPVLGRVRSDYISRKTKQLVMGWLRRLLPPSGRTRVRQLHATARQPWLFLVRWLRLRWLWRVTPLHREFGCYYGSPVDRHYIEEFLQKYQSDICGCVMEIGDDSYTKRFGADRVTRSEVLHAIPGNPRATIVADITDAPQIQSDFFDCIIFTQTLQCIYDFRAALRTLHRILKPNGVLLVTIPGVAHQISREERPYWGDFWRWTTMSAERMFHEIFSTGCVTIVARGNVLTSVALLHGLVIEELRPSDLAYDDPDYELSIGIRAVKAGP